MASEEMNDLFMYMLDNKSKRLDGESSLQVASKDTYMTEFSSADYDTYANFFDVTEFGFNLEMAEDDSHDSSGTGGMPFSDWYQQKDPVKTFADKARQSNSSRYDVQKISGNISKIVDSVSPVFFQNCCARLPFKKGILVKRAFTARKVSDGDSQAEAFLRIIMEDIMITSVAWDDGDVVSEKLQFTCKSMEIRYKQQKDEGKLVGDNEIVKWKWTAGSTT
jgi:type VI protein secretion system component Hcp